jgi:hypothetical protein
MGGKLGSKVVWVYVALGVTALIAIIGWIIQDISAWLKILVIVLLLIAVVAHVFALKAEKKEREVSKYAGKLTGGTVTLLSTREKVYPKLKLGDSNTFIVWRGPQAQPLLRVFEDNDLTIWIEGGQLKLSTKIRNKNGQLVAEIIGNEWKLKREKLWDRNYNRNALEVKDEQGDVVLQVLMKEDYVQFAAKMYGSNGEGFAIGGKEFTKEDIIRHNEGKSIILATKDGPKEVKVGDKTAVFEKSPPGYPLELFIQPIFKYPSDLHLGELLSEE